MTEEKSEYGTDSTALARQQVSKAVAWAESVEIRTAAEYDEVGRLVMELNKRIRRMDERFNEPHRVAKRNADAAMKRNNQDLIDPYKYAKKIAGDKQIAWHNEQERIRAAEQARLQAEADARAEAERKKLEKEAAKLKTPELREQRLEQAAAVVAAPVILASAVPQVKGQSFSTAWRAHVKDPRAAIRAIIEWPDWSVYLSVTQGQIDKFASRTKGSVPVAGIEFHKETRLASASK